MTDAVQLEIDASGMANRRRLRRMLGLLLAPLVFGILLDLMDAAAHLIDVAHGDRWKPSWTSDLTMYPVLSYVGSLLAAFVVVATLFLTGWRSDVRKVVGIFTLTCVVMMLGIIGVGDAGRQTVLATLSHLFYGGLLILIPSVSISFLYCLIAGVPWRSPKAT